MNLLKNKVKTSGLFKSDYLNSLKIVIIGSEDSDNYNINDFIYGRTTDFVAIYSRADYDMLGSKDNNDHHAIAWYFLAEKPTYEEFVTHEIAHNTYDIEYKKHIGDYVYKNNIPAVSDEYSDKIRCVFSGIILGYYPKLETNKFEFNRQQICEVFALLYEREFCKKGGGN